MDQVTRLTGARVALGANCAEPIDLTIRRGRVLPFGDGVPSATKTRQYDLSGHLILPGLINAHDHLEFNLFPRLGHGRYESASQWAADIYHPSASPVKEQLAVPKKTRLIWGGIKNLLSGVTTVAHHNPWEPLVFTSAFPVRVVRRYGWAHSIEFSPDLAERHRQTPDHWPFIVHAAEGTDVNARLEVSRLDKMGVLNGRTALVHAVGAGPRELETIRARGTSIVSCPSSNLFTLGRTLCAGALRTGVLFALGSDSALTGEGDLIDEMRVARSEWRLDGTDIYPLVTANAAEVLRLKDGRGTIRAGGVADLVVVRDHGQTPWESLCDLRPEAVLIGGRIMLASERFSELTGSGFDHRFHQIAVAGRGNFRIRANVPGLFAAAAECLGPEIKLAGKRIDT
ncbi:MAG TPA: amidohydrolase family protein [Bryobacteraceae bacterium]|jgi:cytosine/adenosine deaminase-related metal-dependent hydrolase|nr:amidohydrolase family protein [Bryobacteraceae bacterium]